MTRKEDKTDDLVVGGLKRSSQTRADARSRPIQVTCIRYDTGRLDGNDLIAFFSLLPCLPLANYLVVLSQSLYLEI